MYMAKQIAIVTGSRRGIGKGIAQVLGKNGYYIIVSATVSTADEVLEELREQGVNCEYIKCNVSESKDRSDLIEKVCEKFGRLDVLVNNAGVAPQVRRDLLEVEEESYDLVVNTNARSMFFMCQLAAHRMIGFASQSLENYHPRIVNISSISAYTSSVNRGEYCVSKAAISMTTMLFADRLAEFNIPVFEIRPGLILTDMMSASKEKFGKLIEEGITPIKRFGTPQDIGECVAALCSGQLDFATGQVIDADGGFHIRRL
jgi:NAD(P)-dependent dehydrogenase (short-subunit alcohol dehydrogenase family)